MLSTASRTRPRRSRIGTSAISGRSGGVGIPLKKPASCAPTEFVWKEFPLTTDGDLNNRPRRLPCAGERFDGRFRVA